jgi:YD repeat-containing protein
MMNKIYQYSVNYQYDDLNRLVSATIDNNKRYRYDYDEVGNLRRMSCSDQDPQIMQEAVSSPSTTRHMEQNDQPRWFIYKQNRKFGPYSWNDLISFIPNKKLIRNDLVWCEDFKEWTQAEKIKGLF